MLMMMVKRFVNLDVFEISFLVPTLAAPPDEVPSEWTSDLNLV